MEDSRITGPHGAGAVMAISHSFVTASACEAEKRSAARVMAWRISSRRLAIKFWGVNSINPLGGENGQGAVPTIIQERGFGLDLPLHL